MSILDVFLSNRQRSNRSNFANIVKIAKSNGSLNRDEIRFLRKLQKELDINDFAFRRIVRNPDSYQYEPPTDYEDRIHRLHALTKMLIVDIESEALSTKLLKKLVIGLNFSVEKHEALTELSIKLVKSEASEDDFEEAIKSFNKSK